MFSITNIIKNIQIKKRAEFASGPLMIIMKNINAYL